MNTTAIGGFLVGLGAVLGLLPRLVSPARPEPGIRFGSFATRGDRLRFAVETTGLSCAAGGSVILAVADLERWWLELAIIAAAALLVWGLAAHKLRQLWLMRLRGARDDPNANPPVVSGEHQRELASGRSRWRHCLRHAFAPTGPWPPPAEAGAPAELSSPPTLTAPRAFDSELLERSHVFELHAEDARLADLGIPALVLPDCEALKQQGFTIRVSQDLVSAVAPDGDSASVRRSSVDANSTTAVLARAQFVHQCELIGAKLRVGARGQEHVAGGVEWQLPDPPAG